MLLVTFFVLLSLLAPYCATPALAQDRVFLDLSLDFLGEYKLPKTNLMNTPVGGLSAITYDRRSDRFFAVSDDSNSAPARFYTLKITFNSAPESKIGIQKVDIESVTFLTDKDGQTFAKGTITPLGIAITPEQTVFISGYSATKNRIFPFIQEFDINGKMLQSLPIPERYLPDAIDDREQSKGIQQTSAFESLTFNPTGTIPTSGEPVNLFTATSRALVQDLEPPSSQKGVASRFLHYLIGLGSPVLIAEYFYPIEPTSDNAKLNSLVELISVDRGGHFLSLEGSKEQLDSEKIYQIATGGATDTSRISSLKGEIKGIRPILKKLLLDLNELDIPLDNLQGMTLGPRLRDGTQSLLIVSDDNLLDRQTTHCLLFRLNTLSKVVGFS